MSCCSTFSIWTVLFCLHPSSCLWMDVQQRTLSEEFPPVQRLPFANIRVGDFFHLDAHTNNGTYTHKHVLNQLNEVMMQAYGANLRWNT